MEGLELDVAHSQHPVAVCLIVKKHRGKYSNEYWICASIRPMCTRCCFTITRLIKLCSNFRWARVFIRNTLTDEIARVEEGHEFDVALFQKPVVMRLIFREKESPLLIGSWKSPYFLQTGSLLARPRGGERGGITGLPRS